MSQPDNMSKARTRLLLKSAFFGTLVLTTPHYVGKFRGISTAATNMKAVYYDRDFIADMPVEELMGLIAHEIMHVALMHGFRRQNRDPLLWNMAADYVINITLIDQGFVLPKGGLVEPAFRNMSTEEAYAILAKDAASQPQPGPKPGDPGEGEGEGAGQPGDSEGSGGAPAPGKPIAGDAHIPGTGSDIIETPPGADPEDVSAVQQDVKQRIAQAVNAGRMAGTMPAGMVRLLEGILHPEVSWQDVFRPYMQALVAEDESWSRRNRRFSSIYLPSRSSPAIGKVVVIADTSGSITNDDLKLIAGAVIDIAEETSPEEIHVLWADTEVAGRQEFKRGDPIELAPMGGGGTDMRVPLAEAETMEPDVVVLITDGHTPWPVTAPECPVVTLCTTKQTVPFGDVVRV